MVIFCTVDRLRTYDIINYMKKILIISLMVTSTLSYAEGIIQKVCHEQNGKQICKNIKIHKKFDGTPIPAAPKKKK